MFKEVRVTEGKIDVEVEKSRKMVWDTEGARRKSLAQAARGCGACRALDSCGAMGRFVWGACYGRRQVTSNSSSHQATPSLWTDLPTILFSIFGINLPSACGTFL